MANRRIIACDWPIAWLTFWLTLTRCWKNWSLGIDNKVEATVWKREWNKNPCPDTKMDDDWYHIHHWIPSMRLGARSFPHSNYSQTARNRYPTKTLMVAIEWEHPRWSPYDVQNNLLYWSLKKHWGRRTNIINASVKFSLFCFIVKKKSKQHLEKYKFLNNYFYCICS